MNAAKEEANKILTTVAEALEVVNAEKLKATETQQMAEQKASEAQKLKAKIEVQLIEAEPAVRRAQEALSVLDKVRKEGERGNERQTYRLMDRRTERERERERERGGGGTGQKKEKSTG